MKFWMMLLLVFLFFTLGCTNDATTIRLEGKLVVVEGQTYPNHALSQIDTATQTVTPIFEAPEFSQIFQVEVTTDQEKAFFSYAPPPSGGSGFFDRAGIYSIPLNQERAAPTPLLGGNKAAEYLLMPALSPNGRYLFYTKQAADPNSPSGGFLVTLERYDFETQENRVIVLDGIWPRVSPDGEQVVFIGVEPQSLQRALVLTDLEGSGFEILVGIGRFFDIDAPVFSPDGSYIYFSVAEEAPSPSATFFEKLMGIKTAYAHADHNVPSDWWRVPITGGEPEQITFFEDIILHGDFNPANATLFFTTQTGLFTLSSDGSVQAILDEGDFGTLQFLP